MVTTYHCHHHLDLLLVLMALWLGYRLGEEQLQVSAPQGQLTVVVHQAVEAVKADVLYQEVLGLAPFQLGFDAAMVHTILGPSIGVCVWNEQS